MVKSKTTDSQSQERIFRAATEVFEEKGFAAARMQEIADRAGMNKALLHYYYRSKDQLFRAVFQVLLKKMFEKILNIFSRKISLKEKIRLFYDEHIDLLIRNPKLPIFLLNEISHNPELAEGLRETFHYDSLRNSLYDMHSKELKNYGIKRSDMPQLMITVVSLSVFPVAARDLLRLMMPHLSDHKAFNNFMKERKDFAADFVITALKNRKK